VPEVIPSKVHSCNMQLCEPHLQSCDWRGACPNVIVSSQRSGGIGAAALATHPLAH
jgi:hypothetical protein